MKILVVDDKKENLYLMERMIIKLGYEFVSAENGKQALEKLYNDDFYMIISDILMPVMDGFQFCQAVRSDKKFRNVLFVFYTATYLEKEDEEFAMGLGADLFVRKPIEPESFIEEISELIQEMKTGRDKFNRVNLKNETEILKLYNERLIHKLEKKILDLEQETIDRNKVEKELLLERDNLINILNSMEDGVHIVDKNYNITYVNPSFVKEFGRYEGKKCYNYFYDREEVCPWCKNQEVFKGKTVRRELNSANRQKFYDIIDTPIKNVDDSVSKLAIYRDISEKKKVEQELKESEKKYREAYNRANFYKDLFAHDINNIMQVINSSAELISFQLDETEKSKNIEIIATMIRKQITRAKKLVQNVIILSDLEESHQPIKLTEFCELLRNSINFMNNSFPEREINLQIESLNKRIFVQANELLQDVFENILTNAVKYNDKITVELEIKISKAIKEGKNYVKIEFRDNGIGVADDRKAIIFEKGHRILKGLKGMGLGLSLVKKILTIYDGKIWVEDRVRGDYNQGSNFILLMPQ
jgi:signal transduction histidine kinase/CheY-like chemotaxis protein